MNQSLIEHLRKYARLKDSIEVERFEATLNQIAELKDARYIGPLLEFLDDKCRFPEVMFSIVHTVEAFEHEAYVAGILASLPRLWQSSPYWATVIHVAILNTQSVLEIYRSQLALAPGPVKQAARELLTRIRNTKPKFGERCDQLLAIP